MKFLSNQVYDEKREKVIIRTREAQKAAKNSIFAVHRGDINKAHSLIETAEKVVIYIQISPSYSYSFYYFT